MRQRQADELLSVFEGAVAIQTLGDASSRWSTLGSRPSYAANGIGELNPADGNRAAWANGVLLAENMSLKTFAAELSQHHHGRLEVDPAVANLTLLGAFPLDDLERTLNMVETTLPVKVRRIMPWWIKIEADEASSSEE